MQSLRSQSALDTSPALEGGCRYFGCRSGISLFLAPARPGHGGQAPAVQRRPVSHRTGAAFRRRVVSRDDRVVPLRGDERLGEKACGHTGHFLRNGCPASRSVWHPPFLLMPGFLVKLGIIRGVDWRKSRQFALQNDEPYKTMSLFLAAIFPPGRGRRRNRGSRASAKTGIRAFLASSGCQRAWRM